MRGNAPNNVRVVTFVHRCGFCGWERPSDAETILDPACGRCGSALEALTAEDAERARREDARKPGRTATRSDGTAIFAVLVAGPLVLPALGIHLGTFAFALPLVMLAFATQRLATRALADRGSAPVWWWLAGSCGLAAASAAIAMASAIFTGGTGRAGFYLGAAASACLLAAARSLAVRRLRGSPSSRLVDTALIALVIGALAWWFVVIPGAISGDVALTMVVVLDLTALLLLALAATARGGPRVGPAEWWFVAAVGAATVGDSFVAAAASGTIASLPALTALLWALAGFAFASAADLGFGDARPAHAADDLAGRRWIIGRVAIPLTAVLVLPTTGGMIMLADAHTVAGQVYFGALSVAALVLAFGRQAWLLVERQRAVVRERAVRREATQRNEELEALTGLATTMTQTLEEAPIVEQALGVLKTAARATSAGLHLDRHGRMRLAASAGDWHLEHPWVDAEPVDVPRTYLRGRRSILRLPLGARGRRIGAVTMIRPGSAPFDAHAIELLRLLVDQMGVAVQNARDYREKLEQAIRDPLTGLYNRRFFLEALDKEVQRSERYGSEASLVIFDVDDFKLVNDRHGHAAGDEVLREFGRIAERIIRPVDSFARIGGEEFALLLPETSQLEALLVAERVRTAIGRERILPDRRVTVSGGIASVPSDASTADELQRRADGALYFAKRNGKDLCAVASEATAKPAEESPVEGMVAHLYALVAMIDAQQLHTRDHSENVAAYAVALGQALALGRDRIVKLRRAAMLHDVGKIAVPSAILAKPERLTDDEFEQIQAHPVVGGLMLAHAGLADEADWVRHHHERIDGTGYPDRLRRSQIPLESRILFVADAFEAMTSDRPYQPGLPVSEALAELDRCAGSQFDAKVVCVLAELVKNDRLSVLALRNE